MSSTIEVGIMGSEIGGPDSAGKTMRLLTHLNFGGNCQEAFQFYEKNLGGKVSVMMAGQD